MRIYYAHATAQIVTDTVKTCIPRDLAQRLSVQPKDVLLYLILAQIRQEGVTQQTLHALTALPFLHSQFSFHNSTQSTHTPSGYIIEMSTTTALEAP